MDRITEEGFNLKISRYISTAIAEADMDLNSAHSSLVETEKQIENAKNRRNEFLKELGLP